MYTAQVQLVRSTFEQVRSRAETVATMFYDRLFVIDPSTRPLFKGDMQKQRLMLMSAIGLVVDGLDCPESIIPVVQSLGRRHVGYGVTSDHYSSVGDALLWSLEQVLGASFTPEVRVAWAAAYGMLASLMQAAAAQTTSAALMTVPALA